MNHLQRFQDLSTTLAKTAQYAALIYSWDAFVIFMGVGLFIYILRGRSHTNTPPGPKRYPLIGNLLDFPKDTDYPWLTYARLAETHGDMVYMTALGQSVLILNSYETATDLLERRSAIYSDRPTLPMADLGHFNHVMGLTRYGHRFRKMQQILRKELVGIALAKYKPMHEQEGRSLIYDILTKRVELAESIRLFTGSIIMKATYGYKAIRDGQDPFLHAAEKFMVAFTNTTQVGAWAINFIPWLRYVPSWVPGATFQKVAKAARAAVYETKTAPYTWNKEHEGDPMLIRPNILTSHLANMPKAMIGTDEEDILACAIGSLFGGGSHTTIFMVLSFFLVMSLYPDIQKKGQDEVDQLLGGGRLPNISDRPSLPFIENIMREVLRWRPLANLAIPHRVMRDDEYKGYHIPKDTTILANTWAILHDPEVFLDPEKFDPDRFANNPEAVKRVSSAFGYGRRACPGLQFAEATIFVAIATALATCEISDAVYPDGRPVDKDVLYTSEIISGPPDYRCNIRSRSSASLELLERAAEDN